MVPKEHSKRLLNYFDDGKQRYKHFHDERYAKKSKKPCDTITKINLPKFDNKDNKQKSLKPTAKKLGDAQKNIDVAKTRGISTKEIQCFDNLKNNKLFDEDVTVKPEKKSELVKELEKLLTSFDYNFNSESQLRTAVVVDFMSLI